MLVDAPDLLPAVRGDRLALIIGSSLLVQPFRVVDRYEVLVPGSTGAPRTVTVDDCGDVLVLIRHGDGTVPAHLVDHHAHVRALCALGVNRVIATGSGGGLRPELGPGTTLVPDDVLALTTYPTFHTTTAGYRMPGFDAPWRTAVLDAWNAVAERPAVDGGTYAMVRGPRFETRAEIRLLAQFADVVGMTLPAEMVLAGEAGLAYAAIVKVDNLANGVAGHDLTVEEYRTNADAAAERFIADLTGLIARLAVSSTS